MATKGRAPNFILKAMNKVTDQKSGKIGAAWSNADGTITLVLDMFVKIDYTPDIVLTLFPNDREDPPDPQKGGRERDDHPTVLVKGSTWHP